MVFLAILLHPASSHAPRDTAAVKAANKLHALGLGSPSPRCTHYKCTEDDLITKTYAPSPPVWPEHAGRKVTPNQAAEVHGQPRTCSMPRRLVGLRSSRRSTKSLAAGDT